MVTNLNRSNGRSGSETERRHILIVDDERPILESLRDLLEDEFEVHTTTRGQEAVRLLGEYPVAVLLTDQRMPGMEGDELLSRAAECSLATRIMITGHADLNSVVRAVNRGHIYAYISKPWNPLELKITLSQAAEHYDLMKKYQREKLLLHELLENIPDAIFFKDEMHRYTRVNRAKAALLGVRDPADVEGLGDWDFFPPEEALRITEEDRHVTGSQRCVVDKVELYTPPKGGKRWFSTTKVPSHIGLVGISRDITARRLAEEQTEILKNRIIEAEIEKKTFCREVVLAVTEGKFQLVDPEEFGELPEATEPGALDKPEDCTIMRTALSDYALKAGLSEENVQDLVLMAGEAATNTIKHAVDGTWQAGRSARGVWVRVSDSGGGIKSSELPHALFKKGYSTKISLGLGFTLMLGLADQVKLSTGPRGTTIQMFKQFDDVEDAELDEMLERFS